MDGLTKDGLAELLFDSAMKIYDEKETIFGQEEIRQLEQVGAQVLTCGTCLNHFGIKDRLAAGSVSNMYAIIEILSRAGRIISP